MIDDIERVPCVVVWREGGNESMRRAVETHDKGTELSGEVRIV